MAGMRALPRAPELTRARLRARTTRFVVHSTNFYDSARLLQKIAHFCATEGVTPERWFRLDALNIGPDGAVINVRKAANRTPSDWYRNSLNAVPRFSRDAAAEVLKLYPSMGELAAAVADHEGAVRYALSNAPLTKAARTKKGNVRKLGARLRAHHPITRRGRQGAGKSAH